MSHQRDPGFQSPACNPAPRGRDSSTVQQDRGSPTGTFLITDNLWDLQALGVGGKTTCLPCLPPSSSWGGERTGTVAKLVFLSSHRPNIAAGLNTGFFSNHFLLISCLKANHHLFTTELDRNPEQNFQVPQELNLLALPP